MIFSFDFFFFFWGGVSNYGIKITVQLVSIILLVSQGRISSVQILYIKDGYRNCDFCFVLFFKVEVTIFVVRDLFRYQAVKMLLL